MIKSNFQLEKEKERSILDCITSITGKLNEATVVGFSAPMGGIANAQFSSSLGRPGEGPALAGTPESKLSGEELEAARRNAVSKPVTSTSNLNNSSTPTQSAFNNNNPNWAKQRAKALTNPVLPPLQAGQSTPFVAKGPFVPQGQAQQSSDPWERARAGTFDYKNEVLPSANYDPVVINARKVLATPYETPSGQSKHIEQTLARARASSADTQDLLASGRDLIAKSQAGHERSVAARTELRQTMNNMPSYLPQTSKPSLPDINDLSPDERYRRTMAAGNFTGDSISDVATMKERAAQQTQADGQKPVYNAFGREEVARRSKMTQAQKDTEDVNYKTKITDARNKENLRRNENNRQKQIDRVLQRGGILSKKQLSGESDQFDLPEVPADRIRRRDEDETNSQQSTNSDGSGSSRGGRGGGIVSSGRLQEVAGIGPAGLGGLAAGHAATVLLNKQIKDWSAAAAKKSIDFIKDSGPKVGYIALTPPRELAASATGRLSGLGFSKQGAEERFNYYRTGLNKLGKAGANLATGLAGAFLGTAAAKAAKAAPTSVGGKLLGVAGQLGKDVFDVINPKQYVSAAADEAATLTGAALYDPRMAGMNFKTTKKNN